MRRVEILSKNIVQSSALGIGGVVSFVWLKTGPFFLCTTRYTRGLDGGGIYTACCYYYYYYYDDHHYPNQEHFLVYIGAFRCRGECMREGCRRGSRWTHGCLKACMVEKAVW